MRADTQQALPYLLVPIRGLPNTGVDAEAEMYSDTMTALLAVALIGFVAGAALAICWHRLVLADDRTLRETAVPASGVIIRYALMSLGIGLIAALSSLPVLAVLFLAGAGGGVELVEISTYALIPLIILIVFYVLVRFGLKLPAIALGNDDLTLMASWRLTRELAWPILGVLLFIAVPYGFSVGLSSLSPADIPFALKLLLDLILTALNIVLFLLNISLLTTLYGHLRLGWPF